MAQRARGLWPAGTAPVGGAALGRFDLAALFYAGASICAFLAHEPALVLLGQRGSRALREAGSRARRRTALLACGALLCSGLALALSGPAARLAFVAPLGGACALGLLIWHKQERTNLGEFAACALSRDRTAHRYRRRPVAAACIWCLGCTGRSALGWSRCHCAERFTVER